MMVDNSRRAAERTNGASKRRNVFIMAIVNILVAIVYLCLTVFGVSAPLHWMVYIPPVLFLVYGGVSLIGLWNNRYPS